MVPMSQRPGKAASKQLGLRIANSRTSPESTKAYNIDTAELDEKFEEEIYDELPDGRLKPCFS